MREICKESRWWQPDLHLAISLSGEVRPILWLERQKLRDAWGVWLTEQSWDAFITVTFREPRAGHLAISTLSSIQKVIQNTGLTEKGFLGTEQHLSTALHVHGLIKWDDPSFVDNRILRTILWRKLFDRFGRSQVALPQSIGGVSSYVSKYVVKDLTDYAVW